MQWSAILFRYGRRRTVEQISQNCCDEKFQDRDIKDLVGVALEKLRKEKERQFNKFKPQIRELLIAEFAENPVAGIADCGEHAVRQPVAGRVASAQNGQEYREILAIR